MHCVKWNNWIGLNCFQVRAATACTSTFPTAQSTRSCPTCPAGPTRTGPSWTRWTRRRPCSRRSWAGGSGRASCSTSPRGTMFLSASNDSTGQKTSCSLSPRPGNKNQLQLTGWHGICRKLFRAVFSDNSSIVPVFLCCCLLAFSNLAFSLNILSKEISIIQFLNLNSSWFAAFIRVVLMIRCLFLSYDKNILIIRAKLYPFSF